MMRLGRVSTTHDPKSQTQPGINFQVVFFVDCRKTLVEYSIWTTYVGCKTSGDWCTTTIHQMNALRFPRFL